MGLVERIKKHQRGVSAIVIVLLLTSTLLLMLAGVGELATARYKVVGGDAWDTRARYGAYAGAQYALLNLTLDPDFTATNETVALPGDADTSFTLTVTNNYSGVTAVAAPDGTSIPPGLAYVQSTGNSIRGSHAYTMSMATLAFRGDSYFNHAALGHTFVEMRNGSSTDAFWSHADDGAGGLDYFPYGTGPWSSAGQEYGNVASNGTVNAVRLSGGSILNGVPIVGPLADLGAAFVADGSSLHSRPARVGDKTKKVARYRPPMNPALATGDVVLTAGETRNLTTNEAYNGLQVPAGATLRLSPGVYMFTGPVDIQGTVEVVYDPTEPAATPPVNVYVGDNVNLTNATINQGVDGIPKVLRLAAMGSGQPKDRIKLTANNTQMNCLVGGRGFEVELTNSHLYGAVVAWSVTMDASHVHYDRTLYNLPQPGLATWTLEGYVETEEANVALAPAGGPAAVTAPTVTTVAAAAAAGGDAAAAAAAGDAAGAGDAGGDAAGDAAAGGDAAGAGDAAAIATAGTATGPGAVTGPVVADPAAAPAPNPAANPAPVAPTGPAGPAGPAAPGTTLPATTTGGDGDGDACT